MPIPFESDAVKAVIVNAFGGLMGGQNHDVPGFRGEITYRQAAAVTSMSGFYQFPTKATFNEFVFFKNHGSSLHWTSFFYSAITSIVLPEGITTIMGQALRGGGDGSERYIELPSTITNIQDYNFDGVPALVKIWATTPPTINYNLNQKVSKVMVPQSALAAYQADAQWNQYGSKLEGF